MINYLLNLFIAMTTYNLIMKLMAKYYKNDDLIKSNEVKMDYW